VDASLTFCPSPTTTTTTLPGGKTTTTTTVTTAATTSTTVSPVACAGLSGLAHVQCRLTAALAQPLCGSEIVPPAVDRALRGKLEAASAALGSAAGTTGRRPRKLKHRGVRRRFSI